MKMISGGANRSLACNVWVSSNLTFITSTSGIKPDTAGYAACRFLTKCDSLSRDYTDLSYKIRLGKGKDRKTKYEWFVVPAALMELPGGWAKVEVAINDRGVEIRKIVIADDIDSLRYR